MSEPRMCADCGARLEDLNCQDCGSLRGLTCQNCGEINLNGVDAYNELLDVFKVKIKEDDETTATILRTGMSAATPQPINLQSQAPTSEGKTYPITTIMSCFPKENIWFLGGLSPTALYHDHGILIDKNTGEILQPLINELYDKIDGTPKKEKAEIRALKRKLNDVFKRAALLIDLNNKILLFLDNPNQQTLNKLRPILSHDTYEVMYKITDRIGKGPLRTVTTILRGWPAAIVALTKSKSDKDVWDQMLTRFITISPRQTQKKYRAAVKLTAIKRGLPQVAVDEILRKDRYVWATAAIRKIWKRLIELKEANKQAVNKPAPNIFWVPFHKHIGENFPANVGRHMRDSQRFMSTLQIGASINVFSRPVIEIGDTQSIIVIRQDYVQAVKEFFEGEREGVIFSGVPSHVLIYFKKVVIPLWHKSYVMKPDHDPQSSLTPSTTEEGVRGIEMKWLVQEVQKKLGKNLSSETLRKNYNQPLENAGLMDKAPHPYDRRKNIHTVLTEDISGIKGEGEKEDENHRKSGYYLASDESDIFTLDRLKEELNELRQIAGAEHEITIRDFDGDLLSVDELHRKYFANIKPNFTPAIDLNRNRASEIETSENITGNDQTREYPLNKGKTPSRPSLKEEETIVESLINAMRVAGQVGELWPRKYLEDRGIRREDAINIIEGLRQAGRIIQDKESKTWRVAP